MKDNLFFKVKKLSRLCPANPSTPSDVFILDQRGTDGILALGLFELHSNLQYKEKIIPYLVDVLKGLPNAKWLEAREPVSLTKSPLAGEFAFCFVTLMSGLAAKDNTLDGDIIKMQLSLFNTLVDQCCAYPEVIEHKRGESDSCEYGMHILAFPLPINLSSSPVYLYMYM